MPRTLTTSRVSVPPGREADYVALLARLAGRLRSRGEHLWLFRHPESPGAFLEFSESPNAEGHRTRRLRDVEELALERGLDAIVSRGPDDRVLWEEVPLEER
ncbi:MAG TPA: hypothetical protein VFU23_01475 [Gemmatimonadales bacterium]|nr:hypothetical protein [Gemmatimonadales bacterium]